MCSLFYLKAKNEKKPQTTVFNYLLCDILMCLYDFHMWFVWFSMIWYDLHTFVYYLQLFYMFLNYVCTIVLCWYVFRMFSMNCNDCVCFSTCVLCLFLCVCIHIVIQCSICSNRSRCKNPTSCVHPYKHMIRMCGFILMLCWFAVICMNRP